MKFSILATVVLLSIMFYRPFANGFARCFFILYSIASQYCSIELTRRTCTVKVRCTWQMDVDMKNNAALECIRCESA